MVSTLRILFRSSERIASRKTEENRMGLFYCVNRNAGSVQLEHATVMVPVVRWIAGMVSPGEPTECGTVMNKTQALT